MAETLRREDSKAYEILSRTVVSWADRGKENGRHFHKIHLAPVIWYLLRFLLIKAGPDCWPIFGFDSENRNGGLERINYSQPQRDSHLPIPLNEVEDWYRALHRFCRTAYRSDHLYQFKLNPGEILAFNNIRILHGRTAFKGQRHVEGAYLDWDEVRSRIRTLSADLS